MKEMKDLAPTPEIISTICFTSGTTGDPKGVVLSHGTFISALSGFLDTPNFVDLRSGDVHLSYLPLAHIFERIVEAAIYQRGGAVGFYSGNIKKLMDDIKAVRPTIFISVPRLYNRIYDKLTQGVKAKGGIAQLLFDLGLSSKSYYLKEENGGHFTHSFYDLIFNKLKAKLGFDRVRFMASGAAPLSPHVLSFLRAVFGVPVLEGYGQTENCASATFPLPADTTVGHVGGCGLATEMMLVSIPEMGYLTTDTVHGKNEEAGEEGIPCLGRGEICTRGPAIMDRYFMNPKKTKEAIDKDGWLHSGDIGIWLPGGKLRIFDRKKNIFKLAQGEYVAPEKLENIYLKSPFISQMFVYGNSMHASLCAVIHPDYEYIKGHWKKNSSSKSLEDLCDSKELKEKIKEELKELHSKEKLHGFERIRYFYLSPEEATLDNGLLTPTSKVKRKAMQERYQKEIDEMYANEHVAGQTGIKQK